MYEEIFEMINTGEINKAQEQIEKISDDDPKKYNLKGLIHFNKKEIEKANKKITKKVAEDQYDLFLDNIVSKFMEFTPYTDKYIDSFDFEGSRIRIGKVEEITDEVSLIEFIVKNKKGQQLALQNIWYNHFTKQIIYQIISH